MVKKDIRIKLINEVLNGIKVMHVYTILDQFGMGLWLYM